MSMHTPGPWQWEDEPGHSSLRSPELSEHQAVLRYEDWENLSPGAGKADAANMRLIAAAPTMYDYIAKRAASGDADAKRIMEAIDPLQSKPDF